MAAGPSTNQPRLSVCAFPPHPAGASGDFQQVTRIARLMVTQLGLSKKLGQVAWAQSGGGQFLGASIAQPSDFSQKTADEIDNEVKELVERAYRRAKDLVTTNVDILHKVGGGRLGARGGAAPRGGGGLCTMAGRQACQVRRLCAVACGIRGSHGLSANRGVRLQKLRPCVRQAPLTADSFIWPLVLPLAPPHARAQVAAVLVEKENIDGDEFQQIVLASQAQQYLKNDAPGMTIPYQSA